MASVPLQNRLNTQPQGRINVKNREAVNKKVATESILLNERTSIFMSKCPIKNMENTALHGKMPN